MHEFVLTRSPADNRCLTESARKAVREDGGFVLRNALPAKSVLRLRDELTASFSQVSGEPWTWRDLRRHATADKHLLGLRRALFACPSNADLFRHPRLRSFLGGVLDTSEPFLHPRRWLRFNEPGGGLSKWTTPHHQDYRFVQGTPDVLTVWTPLHACHTGGIQVELRSHHDGLRQLGQRGQNNHLPPALGVDPANLAEPVCEIGDVVVFHSLVVHGTAANPSRYNRISVDARFQHPGDPITSEQLIPAVAPQDKLPIGVPGVDDPRPSEWSGDPGMTVPGSMPVVPANDFTLNRTIVPSRFTQ
ncbi:phytanoyl-CoA dioxygenase family protein [Actinocrispum sp. NPDC049592]|uniref:phytanoyl-CoA dioxygenase family protein n=1 Tax=Actinocrispum sp. NPDC049592 TaxID=3154835 RepID=UPI0034279BC9